MCTITIATNKIKSVRAENAIATNVSKKNNQQEKIDCMILFLYLKNSLK